MQEHLKRLDGVGKVDVSLESGNVAIYPKPDGKLDPARILKAIYDSGMSVAEMTITASGQLIKDPVKGLRFKIRDDQIFDVTPTPVSENLKESAGSGVPLTVRARLYQKPAGKQKQKTTGPMRFEILEVLKKGYTAAQLSREYRSFSLAIVAQQRWLKWSGCNATSRNYKNSASGHEFRKFDPALNK